MKKKTKAVTKTFKEFTDVKEMDEKQSIRENIMGWRPFIALGTRSVHAPKIAAGIAIACGVDLWKSE